tara:strand:+ start:236 stop:1312 length:1077 start_codon:yes stop_codon:yes gene_type:complete
MQNLKEDEIDLIALLKKLWLGRMLIVKTMLCFMIIGIIIALTSPIVYTSSSTFIPQSNKTGSSSGLSGVASLVGINLGEVSSGAEIPPSIYPKILESISFKRELLNLDLEEPRSDSVTTLSKFLKNKKTIDYIGVVKKYTIKLPFTILNVIRGENKKDFKNTSKIFVSSEEETLFKTLDDIILLSVNASEGFVMLSANMSDPLMAALVARGAQEILQKKVIDYKIKSASEILAFNEAQLALKKSEFDSLQNKLALFNDSNLNIIDSRFNNKRLGLQSEFEIVNAVYQELAKQVEQSKLQVSKDTPIFSVINPVTVPNQRSAPKRTIMVIFYLFTGLVLSSFYILIKEPVLEVIKQIKS